MAIYTEDLQHYTGIHWGAVLAGAIASAAFAILLSVLGSGLGFAVVSPWSNNGISAAAFGISAIIWLSLTQIIASGAGGFIAGRLRAHWRGVHSDEVYFTDTLHGFLTWAIALLVTACLVASALGFFASHGMHAAMMAKGSHASHSAHTPNSPMGMGQNNPLDGYYLDKLFRQDATSNNLAALPEQHHALKPEIRRILSKSLQDQGLSSNDVRYVGHLVAQNTGISQEDAERRVKEAYTSMSNAVIATKKAAEKARKASAYITLWGFIALLIGAFTASLAATWGGRCRDCLPGTKL